MWYVAFKLVPVSSQRGAPPDNISLHMTAWLVNRVTGAPYDRVNNVYTASMAGLGLAKSFEEIVGVFTERIKRWHNLIEQEYEATQHSLPNKAAINPENIWALYAPWSQGGWNCGTPN